MAQAGPVHIMGAGLSGLAAATTLASAGIEVHVHDVRQDSGQRFDGDFQALENWSMDADFFDQNADFNNTNDVFTAPVTGKYWISGHIGCTDIDESGNFWRVRVVTSNGNFVWGDDPASYNPPVDPTDCRISIGMCVDMDSGDTAHLDFFMSGGANQVDIFGNNSTSLAGQQSYMTVYLVT